MNFLILALLLLALAIFPQLLKDEHLSGYVYDAKTKAPVPGACLERNGKRIFTDNAGGFCISKVSKKGEKVIIKAMGYKHKAILFTNTEDEIIVLLNRLN